MANARYSISRKIAEGGMAEVYLAELEGKEGFRKPVVLKCIRTAFYADPRFRRMLVDEAHISMGLSHGNIVQTLDLGEAAGRYFLVLELVDGWSLEQIFYRARTTGRPIPPELALFITSQTCRALGYAHAMTRGDRNLGIVHRDVSPQNILVSEQGDVKLTDFGIAKALDKQDKTAAGVVKGKIAFMSPEQAEGKPVDGRSDLFSLGTVLYLLVTGKLPFDGPTPIEAMLRIKAGIFPRPEEALPGIHPELSRLLLKTMSLKREDRYATAEEMLVDVEQVMRSAFRPVGQTELKSWLDALGTQDKVPPISRAKAPPPSLPGKSDGGDPDDPPTEKNPERDAYELSGWVELGTSAILEPTAAARPRATGGRHEVLHEEDLAALRPRRKGAWALAVVAVLAGAGVLMYPTLEPAARRLLDDPLAAIHAATDAADESGAEGETKVAQASETWVPWGSAVESGSMAAALEAFTAPPLLSVEQANVSAPVGAPPLLEPQEEEQLLQTAVVNAGDIVIGQENDEDQDAPAEAEATQTPAAIAVVPDAGVIPALAVQEKPKALPAKPVNVRIHTPPKPKTTTAAATAPKPKKSSTVSVLLQSYPTGAVVKIGNQVFGRTPIPLRFKTGILFEATFLKAGYVTTSRRFFVHDKANQRVTASMKKAPVKKRR